MKEAMFVAIEDEDGNREGDAGWRVEVDGVTVIDYINDLDIGNVEGFAQVAYGFTGDLCKAVEVANYEPATE